MRTEKIKKPIPSKTTTNKEGQFPEGFKALDDKHQDLRGAVAHTAQNIFNRNIKAWTEFLQKNFKQDTITTLSFKELGMCLELFKNRHTSELMNIVWVVTREVNEYNQNGEYFVGVFLAKPTFKDLQGMLPQLSDATLENLVKGGGRVGYEDEWYILDEVVVGEAY